MKTGMRTITMALTILVAARSLQAQDAERQRGVGVVASIGYTQAIQVGKTIYISGIVSRGTTMEAQVTGIYASLSRTLAQFNATLGDVVKETAYTTDIEALKAANEIRKKAYNGHSPTATWVQITRLFQEGATVEIEFVAIIGSASTP